MIPGVSSADSYARQRIDVRPEYRWQRPVRCDLRPYAAVPHRPTMVRMTGNMRPPELMRATARPGAAGRRVGYVISVLVNVLLLWLVTGWPGWQVVPFLTAETQEVIPLVVSLLLLGVFVNLVNFAFDIAWIKALGEMITSVIALVVLVRFWEVFPFEFGGSDIDWALVARVVIAVAVFGCGVSIVVQIVVLVRTAVGALSGPRPDRAPPLIGQERKVARNHRL